MTNENLTLQEALLLLCLNDRTGRFETNYLRYALQAAALAELLRQGRIAVESGKVVLVNPAPVGEELLEVAVSRLAASRRAGKLSAWVRALYRDRKLPIEVLTNRLVRRGILTRREAPLFWFFHRKASQAIPVHRYASLNRPSTIHGYCQRYDRRAFQIPWQDRYRWYHVRHPAQA